MKRAFSLIELLVVIAIILTLASILMPVGAKAKDQAVQTNCISNMRQVYLAVKLYEQDFGDYPSIHATRFAERNYIGGRLLCPATDMNKDSSFVQYDAIAFDDELFGQQWKDCRLKRGEEMPIVFDLWHGRSARVIVGDTWQPSGWTGMVIREHGGLQRLDEANLMRAHNPWLFTPPPELPCSHEPSPLFNL